jgi:acetylornithine deacetylase
MDAVELAKSIIAFKTESPPGNEEACARFIGDQIADLHIEGSEVELHRFERGRANLIARFKGGSPGLMLAGHIDVVPAPDPESWTTPPFEGSVRGGRLYGRGAADMKSAVAAMVACLGSLGERRPKRDLTVVATAGEEVNYGGVYAMIADRKFEGIRARYCVVGEPTEMRVVRAHKGGLDFRVAFEGRSAHASDPTLGVNAIESCVVFVNELRRLRRELARVRDDELGGSLLTPTMIAGGSKSNVIPGSCVLTVDGRLIPAHSPRATMKQIRSMIRSLEEEHEGFKARIEITSQSTGLSTPKDSEVVKLCERLTGTPSTVALYGSEAEVYTTLGMASVVLGPGSVRQAHITDEFVSLRQLRRAESVYGKLIKEVCL